MANLVSEGLVLLQVYKKVLFEVLQIFFTYFGQVFVNVWERVGHILLSPGSRV